MNRCQAFTELPHCFSAGLWALTMVLCSQDNWTITLTNLCFAWIVSNLALTGIAVLSLAPAGSHDQACDLREDRRKLNPVELKGYPIDACPAVTF